MKTFKNKNFTKRDYEATNVVACVAEQAPVTTDNRWQPANESVLDGLELLYVQAGVRYYGYM
jgi:hypothetical protein